MHDSTHKNFIDSLRKQPKIKSYQIDGIDQGLKMGIRKWATSNKKIERKIKEQGLDVIYVETRSMTGL